MQDNTTAESRAQRAESQTKVTSFPCDEFLNRCVDGLMQLAQRHGRVIAFEDVERPHVPVLRAHAPRTTPGPAEACCVNHEPRTTNKEHP